MSSHVAVVTGAGRDLGEAIAQEIAAADVRVVFEGRSLEHLDSAQKVTEYRGGIAIVKQTDVTDGGSVSELFDTAVYEFGRVDVLVNNAGITAQINLADLVESEWDRISDTNVRGMFLCSREPGRRFAEAGSGRAINVASVFGILGRPGFSAYCASKGAVINFTRSVAAEWARFGAQMNAELREDRAAMGKVLRRIPAYRMGQPDESANLVAYLALQAPDFLTGQTIAIDGGESSV